MTLNTITTYCSRGDVANVASSFRIGELLDDLCCQQQVRVAGASAGSYTLTYGAQTSDAIAYNATTFEVQGAMRNLIGLEGTKVTGRGIDPAYFRIRLVDVLGAGTAITAANSLTGGTVAIAQVLTGSAQALDDVIIEATEEINKYLMPRYRPENLALSNWVNRVASLMAADFLSSRKGNPIPESFTKRLEKYWEELEGYTKGWYQLPGIPMRRTEGPSWSNIRIVPRYMFRAQRVETSTSDRQPTTQRQDRDWLDALVGAYEVY